MKSALNRSFAAILLCIIFSALSGCASSQPDYEPGFPTNPRGSGGGWETGSD